MSVSLKRGRRRSAPVVLAAMAVLAVIGGLMLLPNSDQAASTRPVITATVAIKTLRDVLVVRGEAAHPKTGIWRSAVGGRVTAVSVKEGVRIDRGAEGMRIDGVPVIAASGSFPYYRGLGPGSSGDDVRQLQDELRQERFAISGEAGYFGSRTRRALLAWQSRHHFQQDGLLQVGDILVTHLPARSGAVDVEVGDFVQPGSQLLTLKSFELQVLLHLSPSDRTLLKTGLKAHLTPSSGGPELTGTILSLDVAPTADAQGSETYGGVVAVTSTLSEIDGAAYKVEVVLSQATDVLAVPLAAVVLDGSGITTVYVQDKDGKIRPAHVEIGISEGAYVEVKSGLTEGQTILVGTR
jgi:multidrug efflux system membrane fusion protein